MVGTSGSAATRLRPDHRQRAQLAGLDELHHRQDGDELIGVDAADQIADRLRKLDIGHMRRLHAGLELEHLAEQMRGRAEAARRERVLARILFEILDQLRPPNGPAPTG